MRYRFLFFLFFYKKAQALVAAHHAKKRKKKNRRTHVRIWRIRAHACIRARMHVCTRARIIPCGCTMQRYARGHYMNVWIENGACGERRTVVNNNDCTVTTRVAPVVSARTSFARQSRGDFWARVCRVTRRDVRGGGSTCEGSERGNSSFLYEYYYLRRSHTDAVVIVTVLIATGNFFGSPTEIRISTRFSIN